MKRLLVIFKFLINVINTKYALYTNINISIVIKPTILCIYKVCIYNTVHTCKLHSTRTAALDVT